MKPLWGPTPEFDSVDVWAVLDAVPKSWDRIEIRADGAAYRRGSLQVIFSVAKESDGEEWLHVSVCGRRGKADFYLPSWEELVRVRNDFIGADRFAYQVLAPTSEHVNIHPYVLHLWARRDGTPALPDFTRGSGSI
jgi:hypothetical protein